MFPFVGNIGSDILLFFVKHNTNVLYTLVYIQIVIMYVYTIVLYTQMLHNTLHEV